MIKQGRWHEKPRQHSGSMATGFEALDALFYHYRSDAAKTHVSVFRKLACRTTTTYTFFIAGTSFHSRRTRNLTDDRP
jgi:hypothetical protein